MGQIWWDRDRWDVGPGFECLVRGLVGQGRLGSIPVSYTHLRAHETVLDIVCRLLLEKKKTHHSNPDPVLDIDCRIIYDT